MIEFKDLGNNIFTAKIVIQEVHTLDVPDLKEKLQQSINAHSVSCLILDLSEVRMITSSGIGIFLNINQGLKSQLRLAAAKDEVKNVLELTKVTSVIKYFDSFIDPYEIFKKF